MIGDVATPLPGPLLGPFKVELRALFSKSAGVSFGTERTQGFLLHPRLTCPYKIILKSKTAATSLPKLIRCTVVSKRPSRALSQVVPSTNAVTHHSKSGYILLSPNKFYA